MNFIKEKNITSISSTSTWEYEILYGTVCLKYNLHAHLHLPDQAEAFGSIHKIAAFWGEGSFTNFSKNFSGTVNVSNQIVQKLNLKKENQKVFIPSEISQIQNYEFREFAEKLYSKNYPFKNSNNSPKYSLRITNKLCVNQLPLAEQQLLIQKNISPSEYIEEAIKVKYNRKCNQIFFTLC